MCQTFNKNYIYFVIIILSALLMDCLVGLNHNESFQVVRIGEENFSKHLLIHRFFGFFFIIFSSICLIRIEKRCTKSELTDENSNNYKNNEGNQIKLIYNDQENKYKTNKFLMFYCLIIVLWIITEYLIDYYVNIFQDLDFWMIEIAIICYFNSTIYKIQIYKHQQLAMIISLIAGLFKVATIILSFFDNNNYNGHLPIFYTFYFHNEMCILSFLLSFLIIIFGILLYISLISIRSYTMLKIKYFMELKNVSQNKLFLVYGLLGTILYIIVGLVKPECKSENNANNSSINAYNNIFDANNNTFDANNNSINAYNYICKVKSEKNNITYYFENFNIYYENYDNNLKLFELIAIIIGIFAFNFNKVKLTL